MWLPGLGCPEAGSARTARPRNEHGPPGQTGAARTAGQPESLLAGEGRQATTTAAAATAMKLTDAQPLHLTGLSWSQIPDDVAREVLAVLAARDLAAVACANWRLKQLAQEDAFWRAALLSRLPRLAAMLEAAPPKWWEGHSWRQRLWGLVTGLSFQAQVFNRELENEQEDFLLSSYDATCRLARASATALLAGDASRPLLFTAQYLPMGQMAAVVEADVAAERLRLAPAGSSPYAVFGGGSASSVGLQVGEEVEVQWKGRRTHPFGWWFGTVQSVRGNRITLMFRQYPHTSVWHRVKAPIKPGREAVVNGDCSFGYVGGLRRLLGGEREEWRRHGAPHPPAPAQLAALEAAAAEEDWEAAEEDEEFEDLEEIDADLAEMEEEFDELAPPGGGGNGGEAGELAGSEAGGVEEAAHAPGAPPAQPIALQLGQVLMAPAAGAAGAVGGGGAGAGLPVVLAGGAPAQAAAPHG